MGRRAPELAAHVAELMRLHGRPAALGATDPFALVILENVAYLVNDERRAEQLKRAAELALAMVLDVLKRAVRDDPVLARRLLKRFPGLGDPGAEKVLLFNKAWRGLAPDPDILRVPLPDDPRRLIAAHQLLRTHGQQVCKHKQPKCGECLLQPVCPGAAAG